jgi:hypothetical protein
MVGTGLGWPGGDGRPGMSRAVTVDRKAVTAFKAIPSPSPETNPLPVPHPAVQWIAPGCSITPGPAVAPTLRSTRRRSLALEPRHGAVAGIDGSAPC